MAKLALLLIAAPACLAFSAVGSAPRVAAATSQPRLAAAVAPLPLSASSPAAIAMTERAPAPLMMALVTKETNARSAVKAIGWRFTAGIVTAITSYIFTKSLAAAAAIVGWDLCSKSVTMFIGERIWNQFQWGKEKGATGAVSDSAKRSLAKAIAWRIFAAFNTLVGATLLNKGNVGVAGKIAGSDSVIKTFLFYFYERAWSNVGWGKYEAEEAEAA